jgi:hypothetical protein
MTDIRKHGFESDAQWREHLLEIEEATSRNGLQPSNDQGLVNELKGMRVEIAALREQIRILRYRNTMTRWHRVGGALALLLLFTIAGKWQSRLSRGSGT